MEFCSFDAPYLERLRSGDLESQQHFITYFTELIRLKLRKRLHSHFAIEDLRQETFARVWVALRSGDGIRKPERLGAYVNSVCNNVLFEHYRRVARESSSGDGVGIDIPDPAIGVVDAIANKQTRQKVRQILTNLPDKDRLLLTAVFLDECDKDDVCQRFGVNREYLRVLLHRAKNSFRALSLQQTEGSVGQASLESTLLGPNFAAHKAARVPAKRQTQGYMKHTQNPGVC
jgi:RNA polymerase sigma-70 factor (ECF subfamily)